MCMFTWASRPELFRRNACLSGSLKNFQAILMVRGFCHQDGLGPRDVLMEGSAVPVMQCHLLDRVSCHLTGLKAFARKLVVCF